MSSVLGAAIEADGWQRFGIRFNVEALQSNLEANRMNKKSSRAVTLRQYIAEVLKTAV